MSILRFPRVMRYKPSAQLRRQIAAHLATEYLKPSRFILDALPMEMESWGKVRIADGGDCFRTCTTASNRAGRDQSFVRYDLLVDIHANHPKKGSIFETRCFYGQLQQILVCTLPAHELFGPLPRRRLLALVHTCETNGFDAILGLVTYTKMRSYTDIIELTAISCVVGRVQVGCGKRLGIIDRSRDLARPTFIEDPELVTGMEDTHE
ncbi:hypothetical protein K439DRAFT_1414651 [Ramaria rubella]|nr:hypothetical protein K439DRAFT_1414651 [Ramaria rubella]